VYGAFQSYARAFYAELVPPGEEARWFGLFSITDKVRAPPIPIHPSILLTPLTPSAAHQSSSFLGPLLVGLIADLTGNIRYAFFFLFIMVWSAVPILIGVDVVEGRRDARVVGEENKRTSVRGGG
jgi:MFS transporter, UMF1 family